MEKGNMIHRYACAGDWSQKHRKYKLMLNLPVRKVPPNHLRDHEDDAQAHGKDELALNLRKMAAAAAGQTGAPYLGSMAVGCTPLAWLTVRCDASLPRDPSDRKHCSLVARPHAVHHPMAWLAATHQTTAP